MQRLSHLSNDLLTSIINEKLALLSTGKITYDQALQVVSEIEDLYERMYGDRAAWSDDLKKSVSGIRSNLVDFYCKNGLGISFN